MVVNNRKLGNQTLKRVGIRYENRNRKELELKGKNGREEDLKKEKKIRID